MSASTPFPSPEIGEGARPKKRILWKWSLVVTAARLLFLMWQCGSALCLAYKSGGEAVGHFYAQLNEGR
jgi:hypothetical protein